MDAPSRRNEGDPAFPCCPIGSLFGRFGPQPTRLASSLRFRRETATEAERGDLAVAPCAVGLSGSAGRMGRRSSELLVRGRLDRILDLVHPLRPEERHQVLPGLLLELYGERFEGQQDR